MADASGREIVGVFLQRLRRAQPRVLILTKNNRREEQITSMVLRLATGEPLPSLEPKVPIPDRDYELVLTTDRNQMIRLAIAGARKPVETEFVTILSLGNHADLVVLNEEYL